MTYPFNPDIDLDFVNGVYSGVVGPPTSFLTTTRAGTAYAVDASGNWASFAANTPRITNLGLLVEEARTNSIRNNSMQGAVVGTPGTLPTNWSIGLAGLSQQVVGIGTVNGIDYIDLRLFGTTASTSGYIALFENTSAIAAAQNDVWTESVFLGVSGGSLSNITSVQLDQVSIPGNADQNGPNILSQISSAFARFSLTITQTLVGLTNLQPRLKFQCNNGAAVDVTWRVGWPQMEKGGWATSPIRTTSAAVIRAIDNIVLTTPPTYGNNITLVNTAIYFGPPNAAATQVPLTIDDSTSNNRMGAERAGVGRYAFFSTAASVVTFNSTSFVMNINTPYTIGISNTNMNGGQQVGSVNGIEGGYTFGAFPAGLSRTIIGSSFNAGALNGLVQHVGIWANVALNSLQQKIVGGFVPQSFVGPTSQRPIYVQNTLTGQIRGYSSTTDLYAGGSNFAFIGFDPGIYEIGNFSGGAISIAIGSNLYSLPNNTIETYTVHPDIGPSLRWQQYPWIGRNQL